MTGYFDYIEDLIERENTFTMEEFAASVNEFLAFRRYDILKERARFPVRLPLPRQMRSMTPSIKHRKLSPTLTGKSGKCWSLRETDKINIRTILIRYHLVYNCIL